MAARIFDELLDSMYLRGRQARVLCLGGGPGAEVVGLVWAMARRKLSTKLEVHLVDQEASWHGARATTIGAMIKPFWDRDRIRIIDRCIDLQVPHDRRRLFADLGSFDLVGVAMTR